jgi:hypothetical protein
VALTRVYRQRPASSQLGGDLVVTILCGWTFVGWVIALVWAVRTGENLISSLSAAASQAMRRPQPWVNSDITLSAFASRIRRAGRTVSPRRVVSTLPRTIKTTAIAFSGCSMTPSKAVIFGREKLHVLGEANFSDHGANRLGASALMQGLADGYFVIPSTIANYLATQKGKKVSTDQPEFKAVEDEVRTRINRLLAIKGKKTVTTFHRDLG